MHDGQKMNRCHGVGGIQRNVNAVEAHMQSGERSRCWDRLEINSFIKNTFEGQWHRPVNQCYCPRIVLIIFCCQIFKEKFWLRYGIRIGGHVWTELCLPKIYMLKPPLSM